MAVEFFKPAFYVGMYSVVVFERYEPVLVIDESDGFRQARRIVIIAFVLCGLFFSENAYNNASFPL